ncbi:MAG: ribosomal protein S18-alanine N-acetyltransferase [Candidatus Bathyarchaeia archaeon]
MGDLNRVEHIELNTFPNPWTRRIFYNRYLDEPELFLVACVNGEVVGYIVGATEKGGTVGHIMNVAVNEGWKGRGIGTSLLRELEARFIDENVDLAYLEVRISNDRAQKLYRRLGYSKASRIEGYYNDEDALLMVKDMKKR